VSEDTKIQFAPSAPKQLTWVDGTPTEAAYRLVASAIDSLISDWNVEAAHMPDNRDIWPPIEAELRRIRAAMWNAGTCNL
jgi:hypothetical protein